MPLEPKLKDKRWEKKLETVMLKRWEKEKVYTVPEKPTLGTYITRCRECFCKTAKAFLRPCSR